MKAGVLSVSQHLSSFPIDPCFGLSLGIKDCAGYSMKNKFNNCTTQCCCIWITVYVGSYQVVVGVPTFAP